MTPELFFVLTISTQAIFLLWDLWFTYSIGREEVSRKRLGISSLFFLGFVILVYGVIQFGGLALVPQTQILIAWTKEILPDWRILFLTPEEFPLYAWVMLGVFSFYLSGFWDYAVHRFLSHSKQLFFTHEYHHLPNKMVLALPGLSVRPFVIFAIFPATVGTLFCILFILKLIGLENLELMPLVYGLVFIQSIILAITHSEIFMNQWWMHKAFTLFALTSPQDHEIHHTVDLRGNYGNYTMLWDKLFKTYIDPTLKENQNHALGLNYDQDFLGALTAGKLKLPVSMRKRFQVDRFCNLEPTNLDS